MLPQFSIYDGKVATVFNSRWTNCHSFQLMTEKLPHFSIYEEKLPHFSIHDEKLPQFSIYDGKVATLFNS
jgi:hypothetical protein